MQKPGGIFRRIPARDSQRRSRRVPLRHCELRPQEALPTCQTGPRTWSSRLQIAPPTYHSSQLGNLEIAAESLVTPKSENVCAFRVVISHLASEADCMCKSKSPKGTSLQISLCQKPLHLSSPFFSNPSPSFATTKDTVQLNTRTFF